MKKLIALAAAILLSSSALFAENAFHFGLGIPVGSYSGNDDGDFSTSAVDFYADWTRIAERGFTFNLNFAAGSGTLKPKDGNFDFDVDNFAFGAGFGYSFIHNEKMTLTLTGDLGIDILSGSKNSVDITNIEFYIGPKISFTYKIFSHFGLFANAGLYGTAGSASVTSDYITLYGKSTRTESEGNSGICFRPEFGIAVPL
ncbi:MAG: hypothetical protein SPL22_14155 [Treponema sp.]|uniref:outer membrane beta-barrel protein n=1 Tax=Treponema sp. TaxID=166 RepID=UPI002A91A4B0|nr:outer membrane beta-barrel protein [Treponema sp.]MDY6398851.1 hypothetical protein [Treponema sp.]